MGIIKSNFDSKNNKDNKKEFDHIVSKSLGYFLNSAKEARRCENQSSKEPNCQLENAPPEYHPCVLLSFRYLVKSNN